MSLRAGSAVEAFDASLARLVDRIEPWAVYAILFVAAAVLMLFVLRQLGIVSLRRGATPQEIQDLFTKNINGDVRAILAEVRNNRELQDHRHAENQREIGHIKGLLDGLDRLNDMASGRPPPRRRQ